VIDRAMTRTSARTLVIAFALIALSHEARTQQPSAPIRGRVVAADNDRPLRRALISQAPSDTARPGSPSDTPRPVLTDDDGRFEIALARPVTSLTVSKAGYATMRLDVKQPIDRELDVRLSKGAAISGKVVDASGVACIASPVVAQRIDATGSTLTLQTETDDLGEYRIGGLPAGRYTVSVRIVGPVMLGDGAIMESVVSRCLPIDVDLLRGALPIATRSITLNTGDDRSAVDLVVSAPRRPDLFPSVPRQQTETARGRIEGRVTANGGEPLAGALVRAVRFISVKEAQAVAGTVLNTTTDATGRFSLRSLQDGEYRVVARRAGHVDAIERVLADSDPGRPVRIADGATESLQIELVRGGAITGTIVDTAGDPVQGVRVSALQLRRENGRLVATKMGSERSTDDRGQYRVFGLATGAYLLVASSNSLAAGMDRARRVGFSDAYYPGTAGIESAQPLPVSAGSDLAGIDFTLVTSLAARVSGFVVDSSGEPIVGRIQMATSSRSGAIATQSLSTTAEPDGSFELRDVPPGEYVLQATAEARLGKAAAFGAEYVSVVDRDPPSVTIRTSPGATLEGRFVSEGGGLPPMRVLSIHAATIDIDRGPRAGRGPSGLAVHEDGQFYLTGIHGEVRFTLPDPPSGWYVKSFTIGGIDVTDGTFDFGSSERTVADAEIVLSSSGATIAGVVNDGRSRACSCVVVAFPADRRLWFSGSRHVKQRRVEPKGTFEIDGLPPGDYWVAAVDRLDTAGDWQTADALDALVVSASRLTVRDGQVVSTSLRLIRREP
jgi:hypothetical protein